MLNVFFLGYFIYTMDVFVVNSATARMAGSEDEYKIENPGLSTSGEVVPEGAASHENETEPPPDTVYIICGVIIAMVMVGVIIVLLAVTISKLRKREDHSNEVHPEQPEVVQMAADSAIIATTTASQTVIATSQEIRTNGIVNPVADCITASEVTGTIFLTNDLNSEKITWQFPPPYPPPHTPPPQYTLYKDQDTLVHGLDRPGFAKGIRKNLGGRWRRLVKRKSDRDTCAIPPELKDQLKTIYVY